MICSKCGAGIPLYMKVCPNCSAGVKNEAKDISGNDPKLEGFKGWLILLAFSMILTPLIQIYNVYGEIQIFCLPDYLPLFQFTSWKVLGFFSIAIDIVLLGAIFYMEKLFWCKRKSFPMICIIICVLSAIYCVVMPLICFLTARFFFNPIASFSYFYDIQTLGDIFRTALKACIWVPYLLISKRVKATFRN